MYNITKLPVVIVSGTRTGSTVLAHDVREELEEQGNFVRVFNEPMSPSSEHERNDFLSPVNNNYILKAHAHDLVNYPKTVLDMIGQHDCFLIRIRRKNLEEQILSHYIARMKKTWGYYKDHTNDDQLEKAIQPIIVSDVVIKNTIDHVVQTNKTLANFNANFDLDLFYEDIEIKSNHLLITPQPENYSDIRDAIRRILLQKEY